MRQLAAWSIIVFAALSQSAPIHACGEKLLVLGRGVRFQSRHTPRAATVLLYLSPNLSGRPLRDPNLETALKEAGHAVRAVTTRADFESAVRTGNFDVVLADLTDAPDLEQAQAVAQCNAFVLPAVYLVAPGQQRVAQQTKSDQNSATKSFGVVIEVPGRPGHYCAAVDKALELKLKRAQSVPRQP